MESAEIRRRFLDYFERNAHTVVPSASLLLDDPTLLFVNAGMVPFKPYFLGEAVPPYKRAASVQKVVRTLDIEEVGKTTRHASFFQMCGNFSFGDYFKEQAIPFAWELLTSSVADGGYGFDESKLWVTVYEDDDETAEIWHQQVGVPRDRIQRRGQVDNFWSMGVPGPCGPCSEIYFDRGAQYGRDGGPVADEDRYLEVWNLVFMQFVRGEGPGKEGYPILGELPSKNIDTGMGLERMAALLQGVDNIYEIDTTKVILDRASALTSVVYGKSEAKDVSLRVVADHARTCAFLIADGVIPGNEGRGYVLRRILRRVVRNMRLLGANDPVMGELIDATVLSMGPQYPELLTDSARIRSIAQNEEAAFLSTLKSGTAIFDVAVKEVKAQGGAQLSGDKAFALHDTYGFPIDLTLEMAAEAGLQVDEVGFRTLMKEQRERAKADARARKSGFAAATAYRDIMERVGATQFVGYEHISAEAKIGGLLKDGNDVKSALAGEHVEVVLDVSPFYAESGGQLGDHGRIRLENGALLEVYDVQAPVPGLFVHRANVIDGEVVVGERGLSEVDLQRRSAISRAHTATHMIHKAFRELLGDTATQMGSENSPGRLRFDFPAPGALSDAVMNEVEARVNSVLLDDLPVTSEYMSQAAAREIGAMALFGEKYGDTVRVVSVGEWARELCGGTHTPSTGHLGVVKFLGEGSIGAGVRRVEALVGTDAYNFLAKEHILLNELSSLMKARPDELVERLQGTLNRLREAERELERLRQASLRSAVDQHVKRIPLGGGELVQLVLPSGTTAADLRTVVMDLKGKSSPERPEVFLGAAVADGKIAVVVAANNAAVTAGISAGTLLSEIAPAIDGRGGGKPDLAQGGGTNAAGLEAALAIAQARLAAWLSA